MRVLGSSGHKYDYSKFPRALELPSSQTLGVSLQFARTYSKTRNFEKPFVPPFKLLPLRRAVPLIIAPASSVLPSVRKSHYLIFPFYTRNLSFCCFGAYLADLRARSVPRCFAGVTSPPPRSFFVFNGHSRPRQIA